MRLLPLVVQFQLFIRTLGMLQLLSVLMLLLLRKEGCCHKSHKLNGVLGYFLFDLRVSVMDLFKKLDTNLRIRPIFNPFLYYRVICAI